MFTKFDYYSALAEDTASHLTKSREQWTAFLRTAGRVSKYTYEDQLMIYAQRPDATACAEYDLWNSTMRRYVKKGAKGIALIDNSWDRPRLRYVFDVSDTGARKNSREVNLWHMKDEYVRPVQAALEAAFEVTSADSFDVQIENIANWMAIDYWQDHEEELRDIVAGSFLEGYDDDNRRISFTSAAAVSIKYEILSRCVADPDEYVEPDEFLPVYDYSTRKAVNALGTAVSEASGRVFREIEVTIRNYERSRRTERSQRYGTELYEERGLFDPEHRAEGEQREATQEVRQDAQGVPEGAPSNPVQRSVADGAAVSASAGDRRDSTSEAGPGDGGTAYEEPDTGQEDSSDGVGTAYEQPESAGGGDHHDGTGVQLIDGEPDSAGVSSEDKKEDTISEPAYEQMTLFFPTEAEQIKAIDQEAESEMPSAFSIPQSDIDNVLRLGGSSDKSRMVVAAEYMKGKSVTELAAFLRTEYRGGMGVFTGSGRLSAWFGEEGIRLAAGDRVRNEKAGMLLSWEDAAERIGELLDDGQFATNVEIEETPGYARTQIAEKLWYLRRDFSEITEGAGLLTSLELYRGGGYPDETARLAKALADPEVLAAVTRDMMIFTMVYEQEPDVLRFHYHKVPELHRSLRELGMTWKEYSSDMTEVPQPGYFITEDEIDEALAHGSSVSGGKGRIYSYFTENHSAKELVDFLRDEYGTGGHSGAFANKSHSYEDHGSKGITFKKMDCIPVTLSWSNVAKRISALIKNDRYLTEKEKQQLAEVRSEEQTPATEEQTPVAEEKGTGQQAEDVAYEFVTVNGTPALFSNGRIKEKDIPAGLFHYDLRGHDDDPGDPYCVEERVFVNHAGSVVTATPLPMPESGYIPLTEENDGLNFHGWDMGIREFQSWYQLKAEARECLEHFLPRVAELVMADSAYRNACKNSDAENVEIELGYAIGRAINSLKDVDLYRFYYDDVDFHKHMDEDVFDETYYNLRPRLPHELKTEQTEDDPFPDIDPVEIREELERRGIINGELVDPDKESLFVRQVMADVERIAAEEAKDRQTPDRENADNGLMPDQEDTAERNTEETEILPEDAAGSLAPEERFHVVDTEFGSDGAYSIWDDKTGDYYVDTDGNHVYFSDRWVAEDYRDELIEKAQEEAARSPLDRAKELLDEYCMEEFGEPVDLSDMSRIGIGYTTITDEDIPIEASVNLEDFKLERYLNGVLFDTRQYGSLEELVSKELEYLDFDKLMDATDDEIEEVMAQTSEASEELTEDTPEQQEMSEFPYHVGDTVYLEDGKAFTIESIGMFDVQLRDPSLQYPVFRAESRENFLRLVERYPQNRQPEVTEETVAVYPGEETRLPYDVEIRQMRFNETTGEQQQSGTPDREVVSTEVTEPVRSQVPAHNFRITDDHLGEGGSKQKYARNVEAIRTLFMLEEEKRNATPEEQEILSQYVGWGGIADAFDPNKTGWAKEYQELKALLPEHEYEMARGSTLNAHYTSPTVIKAIYEAVGNMGFIGGNILEPSMGVGNFFGLLPDTMAGSRLYGVELDSITGRIAQKLYPQADIKVAGFETTDRRDFYDLAVGNVPFGQYKVSDKPYDKLGFSIHNYFFAKALDQVRPGGVVAFVTSRYTMDAKSPDVRRYLAQRAELLGAIRLPNNAFKANAGTEVVSDIIFLQKRDHPIDIEQDWIHLDLSPEGYPVNRYFVDHPEMILGTLTEESTQYGMDVTVAPIPGAELSEQLHEAVSHIHGSYHAVEMEYGESEEATKVLPADPDVKNYSFTVVDGEVYFRENSLMRLVELNETAKARVKGLVELRQVVNDLIEYQTEDYPEDAIREKQKELNRVYDAYTANYGLINSRGNAQAFSDDSSYYLLCSLENIDEDGQLISKADMFTKRTIRPERKITSVDTPSEALAVSIGEHGRVDLPYMAELLGTPGEYASITEELRGVIFKDPMASDEPEVGWQTADEYLSGNVREKLRIAQMAAEKDSAFAVNVDVLTRAQPKDLEASEIDVRLGATWVDKQYIQRFMQETFELPFYMRRSVEVKFSPITAEWQITGKSSVSRHDVTAYVTYGTHRASAYRILEDTLNLKDVRIYDTIEDIDGKQKRVLNKEETTLAQQKQQAIKDAFREWVWKDPARREALCKKYNELFNSTRPREYDGSHIRFGGMNPDIKLRPHQQNAIAHVLYGGNTLLAHEVGARKTFEMAASAMESKRLGLCQKSLFVVPNHLTLQWANEFLRLYPSANLLVASKKDFETANRKKFCARISTGDYDAVIIGHSQFEKIPVSAERQERLLREQIDEITAALSKMKFQHGENFSIKQMEKTRKSLQARLDKMLAADRKDDVITFEQLGVDRLFVDESHFYKNLFLFTKMRNVAGLSTSEAQKSQDMFMKCRYMDEITGGRGVVFATGTPVSNSMTELYTVMRYLQYGTLQQKGLTHFDCWASTFGETQTAIELAPEGTGYRARTRFAKFFNLPELMNMFKEVADIKTSDQLDLPVPDAKFETEVVQPSEHQKAMVASLSERAAKVHSGSVDASVDNMLKITSDGRKLGLDQRLMNPLLPDDPNSKLNACVKNVLRIWEEGKEEKLTQLLFCDLSTPKKDGSFNVYDDIRSKLIAAGVPEQEVAFIHTADTEAKKKELFAKVRSGQVRVLLGSTQKMGAGTNVQDRLIAVHHLDVGWRPSDMTQRNGRIIRQGNRNPEVQVYQYVTEGTFDAYLYQTLENKQKFISQIMTSKSPVRSCDDVDEQALSYAEIKALCAGNPLIKEKMDLDIEVARLKVMKADHLSQRYRLEDKLLKYYPAEIEKQSRYIKGFSEDIKTVEAHPQIKDGFVGMKVGERIYTERVEAGEAILAMCKQVKGEEAFPLGEYRGFKIALSFNFLLNEFEVSLKASMSHRVSLGKDARGNITRIDNVLAAIPTKLQHAEEQFENLTNQQEAARIEVQKPFAQEAELAEKSARLAKLDAALNMDDGHSVGEEISEEQEGGERASVLDDLKAKAGMVQLPQRSVGKEQSL